MGNERKRRKSDVIDNGVNDLLTLRENTNKNLFNSVVHMT